MSDDTENKNYKEYLVLLIMGLIIGYFFGSSSINIKRAYNYILDNPAEYMSYVNETYEKSIETQEKCIEDIDNCPTFVEEKKYREKQFKDNIDEMEKSINAVKQNILSNLSHKIYAEDFMIDTIIKNNYLIEK